KWPNDIYIDAKKVTGILIESYLDPAPAPVGLVRQGFAIAGIGVNVNQTAFPPELKDRAASLRQLTGRAFDRQRLAVAILRSLDAWYRPLEHDFASLLAAAEARSFLKGKWITATLGGTEISGEALRLDDTGGLVLRLPDGTETTISSGEVTVRW
ncbi:MAG TPA: biotin--[acetyl-CoA-carboxylase] ligase, partial [Chthoniobacteraceae bacterium]|nr:biotin--[acetyl-CoA-carboxylase] ligase [Chthoniobacteraceae bacterium]